MRCQSRNCRPSSTSCFQCPTSYAFQQPHPAAHRTASYPENPGRLGLRKTLLNSLDDSPAKIFLGFSWKRTSILFFHARNTTTLFRECHLYYAPISNDDIRTLIGDPDVVLRINFDCVCIGPCVEVVANLAQKFSITAEFQQLCSCRAIRGASRIAPREHEDMTFRIHSDTGNLAKIEVGWEVQEIRHRAILNFEHPRRLCRKRRGLTRNCQQKENCRELHFHSSPSNTFKNRILKYLAESARRIVVHYSARRPISEILIGWSGNPEVTKLYPL